MSNMAESSGAALERFIAHQLAGLSLTAQADDVELMARFVEEEGLERDEKIEGVRGMLEGVVSDDELPVDGVDAAIAEVIDEWERIRAENEAKAAEEIEYPRTILSTLSPEELAAAQRAALLRRYAYVEGGPEEASGARPAGAPPRGSKAEEAEEKRKAEERRKAIEAALKMDSKKKKHRKQDIDDPLMWDNLNKDKVQYRMQMEREAAKAGAAAKKERDRAALDKQRADAAKAKADKQKKAAKQERRA